MRDPETVVACIARVSSGACPQVESRAFEEGDADGSQR